MRLIHYSHSDPATNLALEESILDAVEQGHQPDTLRFWECPTRFVVLGTGQALAEEVHEDHCQADGVPILRRYRELGGEYITVGSDAHTTRAAGVGVEAGFALLRDCGFRYVTTYRKHLPEMIKL